MKKEVVNRSYYAVFHAIKAALLSEKVGIKKNTFRRCKTDLDRGDMLDTI